MERGSQCSRASVHQSGNIVLGSVGMSRSFIFFSLRIEIGWESVSNVCVCDGCLSKFLGFGVWGLGVLIVMMEMVCVSRGEFDSCL